MLSQQLSLRMILNRLDKLGSAALALTLAVSLSGCDPPKPASVATPASQAFAPALAAPADRTSTRTACAANSLAATRADADQRG